MQKMTTCLWFDGRIDEALEFYPSVFPGTKVGKIARYPEGGPMPKGTIITATFELLGQEFMLLNGGPHHPFNESVSFVVHCETQTEVDDYWRKLTEGGGSESQCGWLKDKFGLSWQVVPNVMLRYLGGSDAVKAGRAMQAMMKMKKIDIAEIERAVAG